jgi:hypothetical protein
MKIELSSTAIAALGAGISLSAFDHLQLVDAAVDRTRTIRPMSMSTKFI